MFPALSKAYTDTISMIEDGVRKIPEEKWRAGQDDYLVPARIVYHLLKSLEWLTNELPVEEFKQVRRYPLNWLGPVEPLPGQAVVLPDLPMLKANVLDWLQKIDSLEPSSPETQAALEKGLYFLRHTQHHIGELAIIARLSGCEAPEWK